ncbi:MAG TPA: cytochrome c oxidase subunit II, partial [Cytophagales bacterium]|nr:cytochrome c oxidase subunit II [Cytophagales bacterium]
LVLAVLFLVYRVTTISSAIKGASGKPNRSANRVNAILFPVFLIVMFGLAFWYSPIAAKNYLPDAASETGVETDFMFWITIYIISAVVAITHILLLIFPYLYQYKEGRKARYFPDNNALEIGWTIAPAIVLAGLIAYGWSTWSKITGPAPAKSHELEIMGFQFAWKVRYPGQDGKFGKYYFRNIQAGNDLGLNLDDKDNFDDFIPNEIHIPVGEPVKFNIRARDVLHSVFLPHFRQKMDAVPGMPTSLWFTPLYTTAEMRKKTNNPQFNYELACTEVCGKGHYSMRYIVVVDTPEDYKKWYASNNSWLTDNDDIVKQINPDLRKHIPNYAPKAQEVKAEAEQVSDTTVISLK